jgi:uncharacterized protein (DUF1697 family)
VANGRPADGFLKEINGEARESQQDGAPFGEGGMSRSVILLRGVNVGGRNKLPMKNFALMLEGLGCGNVRTYIQSGNAVVDGAPRAEEIAAAIKREAGFACRAFVISAAALKKAAALCPFKRQAEDSGKSVHVFFLDLAPKAAAVESLAALRRPREDFAVAGKTLYLLSPDGVAGSQIAEKIDRTLGVATTARNWNTIMKLIELVDGE